MSESKRFDKIESKVDSLHSEIYDVKAKVYNIEGKLDTHMAYIKEHVAGDTKIINEIRPLIADYSIFKKLAEDHVFLERKREERMKFIKKASVKLGLVSTFISVVYGIYAFFR